MTGPGTGAQVQVRYFISRLLKDTVCHFESRDAGRNLRLNLLICAIFDEGRDFFSLRSSK